MTKALRVRRMDIQMMERFGIPILAIFRRFFHNTAGFSGGAALSILTS